MQNKYKCNEKLGYYVEQQLSDKVANNVYVPLGSFNLKLDFKKYCLFSCCDFVLPGSSCKEIESPYNGKLSTPAVAVGTKVTVSCSEGYLVEGQAILQCKDDGQWSHVVPKCVFKHSGDYSFCFYLAS